MASSECSAHRAADTARSWLFVPGDSERKLARASAAGADALILDLEDSVPEEAKTAARERVAAHLRERPANGPALWVRINPPSSMLTLDDLAAVVPARPNGLVVPKVSSPLELRTLATELDRLEQRLDAPRDDIKLMPIATETPQSLFTLADYTNGVPRVTALTWGAEDLSAALGATTAVGDDGEWLFVYQLARSLCLAAARALRVATIDTVYTDFRDEAGLRRQAQQARRDGFMGKLAIHPSQVATINETFSPTRQEIEQAERVVAAFAAAHAATGSSAGVVALDGKMLDRPHLARAQALLARTARLREATKS